MFNTGSFKNFLKTGSKATQDGCSCCGIPRRRVSSSVQDAKETPAKKKEAKTALVKSLIEHDLVYHKDGYKPGDKCNFREALMRGDSSDSILAAEKKEGEARFGVVKFTTKPNGKKVIVGIEDLSKAVSKSGNGKLPSLESLSDMPSFEACKYGPYGDDDRSVTIENYGKRNEWKSRKAAIHCYSEWAAVTEGSEQERYQTIADYLMLGADDVNDNPDAPTKSMLKVLEDATDESPRMSLEEHDKRFHPNGYKPGSTCQFREALARGDDLDGIEEAEKIEAYMSKVNAGKESAAKSKKSKTSKPDFTDENVRKFAEKWLADNGHDYELSADGGVQKDGSCILGIDNVNEDDADEVGEVLSELLGEVQDAWSDRVHFSRTDPAWHFEPSRDRDGSFDDIGSVTIGTNFDTSVDRESIASEYELDLSENGECDTGIEIMSDDLGELASMEAIKDAIKAKDRTPFNLLAQRLSNHAMSELEDRLGDSNAFFEAIFDARKRAS